MIFDEIQQNDKKYIMQTYGRFPVALAKGKNATVWDEDGKEYIDFSSGVGVNCLGYCDEQWSNAVAEQAHTIQHLSNYYYNPLQTELAKQLCEITKLAKVFFTNSGAEANECAIKLARKYSFDKYGKERTEVLSLNNSFHGRTITTLSATGQEVFHNYFFPFTPGFTFADANNIESVKNNITKNTCAVMIELIQGEGGVLSLDKKFVKELAALCKENDLLLIIDEVQTGVGRTGSFYAYEQYEITPDVLTTAKGLGGGSPLGACLCTKKFENVLTPSTHGTTYGGNPMACAGALVVLKRVANEAFLKQVTEKGNYFKTELEKIEGVLEVRGKGLMIGVVLEKDNAKDVALLCNKNGLLAITAKNLLRFLPPLTITYDEIDKGLEILKKYI